MHFLNSNISDASKVRLTSLPFYDINHVLLSPTILMPTYKNDGVSMGARFFFNIPPSELGRLAYRDQPEATPRYEIQMRMVSQLNADLQCSAQNPLCSFFG